MFSFPFPEIDLRSLRGGITYLHSSNEMDGTAYDLSEDCIINVEIPRILSVRDVSLELYSEDHSSLVAAINAEFFGIDRGNDVFTVNLDSGGLGVGLYFFRFKVCSNDKTFYGYKNGEDLTLSTDTNGHDLFQLTLYSFTTEAPEHKYGGIIYHVFVDRFNKTGHLPRKDGAIIVEDWSRGIPEFPPYRGAPLKNNTFYGGTLKGISDKLDYIASLGVDTLYLSPIFDSPSNHKYDTADYMSIDPMFGDDRELQELIDNARQRGIGIILDGVFNHTGADSVYFNRYGKYKSLGAYQSKDSPYFEWFDFRSHPDTYTCWWGIEILPRINPDIPSCRSYFVDKGGVIDKYSKMGIEGFRLDVVDELSDDFVALIKNRLNENNPRSVLYGEVWEDGSNKIAYDRRKKYYLGSELDGVMNYPIRNGIIEYLKYSRTDKLKYALTEVLFNAPPRVRNLQMNLIGSHDTARILTSLGAPEDEGKTNEYLRAYRMSDDGRNKAIRLLRMAYTILSTIPGIPSIYYGDEVGMEGYNDPFNRLPYPWGREDIELLSFYKLIGRIRREQSVFTTGSFKLLNLTEDLLVYSRRKGDDLVIIVVNNSSDILLSKFQSSSEVWDLISDSRVIDSICIEGYSVGLYKCKFDCDITFSGRL